MKEKEFLEKYELGYDILAHKAFDEYVAKAIEDKARKKGLRKKDGKYEDITKILKTRPDRVNGQAILIASIPGLLKNTGQAGGVGLGKWNGKPVAYLDSKLFYDQRTLTKLLKNPSISAEYTQEELREILKSAGIHEMEEIGQYEAKRHEQGDVNYEEMRGWVRGNQDTAQGFHDNAESLDKLMKLYEFVKKHPKEFGLKLKELKEIFKAYKKHGFDRDDDTDFNISARVEGVAKAHSSGQAQASHFGKYKDVEFTPGKIANLLEMAQDTSEKRPSAEEIKATLAGTGTMPKVPDEHYMISTTVHLIIENFGEEITSGFFDDNAEYIPIKKVPAGQIGSLAITVKTEDGKKVILVEDIAFNMPHGLYIALVDEAIHNSIDSFTYEEQVFATIHQILAYLSLKDYGRKSLLDQIEKLKGERDTTNFDEFIAFADIVVKKIIHEDFKYLESDEFLESLTDFVKKCYSEFRNETAINKQKVRRQISTLAKTYRIGQWILQVLCSNTGEALGKRKEKIIVRQINGLVRAEWINWVDFLSVLHKWGIGGSDRQRMLSQIIKDNSEYFDSDCIEAIVAIMSGSYTEIERSFAGMVEMEEIFTGIERQSKVSYPPEDTDLKKQGIMSAEGLNSVASYLVELIARIYPDRITKKVFYWVVLSLKIFLKEWMPGGYMHEETYDHDSRPIFELLKSIKPDLYAQLLVESDIEDVELAYLVTDYMHKEAKGDWYGEDERFVAEEKYIDLKTVEHIAKIALSSGETGDIGAAQEFLRRIVRLRPVYMLKLFNLLGEDIYKLFDELKDIPVENFRRLDENKNRWGLSNDFVALCVGDKPADSNMLALDSIFEKESPFVCIKITKRLFDDGSDWRIDTVKELYGIPLFASAWNFHDECIDEILSLNEDQFTKLFIVLRESMVARDLYAVSGLFSGYRLVAILEYADDILALEDAMLRYKLTKLRELVYQREDLEPSLYVKLLLAKDEREFDLLYADILLSGGFEVELKISQGLREKLEQLAKDFEKVEPTLTEKKTAETVFFFILELFDLRGKPITGESIKNSRRRLAMIYHFDRGGRDEIMSMVNIANGILEDFVEEDGEASIKEKKKEPARLGPNARGFIKPADDTDQEGSPAHFLETIQEHFLEEARSTSGFAIDQDFIEKRGVHKSTVYREIEILRQLGILEKIKNKPRYRFTKLIRGDGDDSSYTENLINVINNTQYKLPRRHDERPLYNGSIPDDKIHFMREFIRLRIENYIHSQLKDKLFTINIYEDYAGPKQDLTKIRRLTENAPFKASFKGIDTLVEEACNPSNINDRTVTILPYNKLNPNQVRRLNRRRNGKRPRVIYINLDKDLGAYESGPIDGLIAIGRAYLVGNELSFYRLYQLLRKGNKGYIHTSLRELKQNPYLFVENLHFVLRPIRAHNFDELKQINECIEELLESA
ncbi:MAG: hypothetical protein HQ575_02440 [Candidatus Omnitrophica bacterium]|nr:hypothetical protein [Candidatus Omnitrophota bacterium]